MYLQVCFRLTADSTTHFQECQVDEQGKFMDGVIPELRGLRVLEEGNQSVLQLLSKCCAHTRLGLLSEFVHNKVELQGKILIAFPPCPTICCIMPYFQILTT